jgi:hypothetical protein
LPVAVTQIVSGALTRAGAFSSPLLWGFCLHFPNTESIRWLPDIPTC